MPKITREARDDRESKSRTRLLRPTAHTISAVSIEDRIFLVPVIDSDRQLKNGPILIAYPPLISR